MPLKHPMKMSPRGLVFLTQLEGIVPGPYLDSVGVWTYGIGHTASAGKPDPAQMPRGMPVNIDDALVTCFRLLQADIRKYEREVNAALDRVPIQEQFDAMCSFHYNTGGIARAKLTEAFNAGDAAAAAEGFMGWLRPPEIRERREKEQRLFREGVYAEDRATVWSVDDNGRVIWKPVARLSVTECKTYLLRAGSEPQGQHPPTPHPEELPVEGGGIIGALLRLIAKMFAPKGNT